MVKMTKEVFGTKEWSESSANFITGCQHDCLYGYCKAMAVRFKRATVDSWKTPVINEKALMKPIGKRKGTIMFPSTHDIHPDNLSDTMFFLSKLLRPGNNVLIVSKPHIACIQRICEAFQHYREQILFRFTIGSVNDDVLKFWEPGAPHYHSRLLSLVLAHEFGYKTSVSMEPMLDKKPEDVIDLVRPYVTDSIWLGKMNDPTSRLKINGHSNIPSEFKDGIRHWMNDENVFSLYERYHDDPLIKWKESIKKVIGLKMPEEKGMDI